MRPCPTPARSTAISDVEAATSDRMGLPRLPVSPFPRAAPNTPADRMAACVGCFAIRAAFPVLRAGRHPHLLLSRPAQASLTLQPTGSLNRPRRPLSRGFNPASHPTKSLVSYQGKSTIPWVESPSTGQTRPRGAPQNAIGFSLPAGRRRISAQRGPEGNSLGGRAERIDSSATTLNKIRKSLHAAPARPPARRASMA